MTINNSSRFLDAQFSKGRFLRAAVTVTLLVTVAFLSACHRNINIISKTVTTGAVNGAAISGNVTATIYVGRGGQSSCTFEQLPPSFTPSTLFSMA
jgi:hypothetical protein